MFIVLILPAYKWLGFRPLPPMFKNKENFVNFSKHSKGPLFEFFIAYKRHNTKVTEQNN